MLIFRCLGRCRQSIQVRDPLQPFITCQYFYDESLVASRQIPKLQDHPLRGCQLLIIQFIRSYSPYLEAVSLMRNLGTRHVGLTRGPLNMYKISTCPISTPLKC